jgi:TonB family protein
MKKIVVLIYCMALETLSLSANSVSGIYRLYINRDITCFIDLYPDNRYNLSLFVSHTDDINEEVPISIGKYKKTSNAIIFTDTVHGFTMRFQRNADKSITVNKGFVLMKGKVFHYCSTSEGESIFTMFYNIKNQKQERSRYTQTHTTLYPVYYATYESENNTIVNKEYYQTELGYELKIQKENKYALYYKGILISEGQWKRNGNELSLFDVNLQHFFYVLTGEKGLISKYLPGDYRGMYLFIKKARPANLPDIDLPACTYKTPVFPVIEKKIDTNEPMRYVEVRPQFPHGGDKAMLRFIKENTHYPEGDRKTGIKGRVVLNFVVERDGTISTIEVIRKLSPLCDEEAIRIVKSMPRWIPGRHNGVNVAVRYMLPVDFGKE